MVIGLGVRLVHMWNQSVRLAWSLPVVVGKAYAFHTTLVRRCTQLLTYSYTENSLLTALVKLGWSVVMWSKVRKLGSQSVVSEIGKSNTLVECGPIPSLPMSTSCPPDVINLISIQNLPRFFFFFFFLVLFRFCVLYWTQTKEQEGKA